MNKFVLDAKSNEDYYLLINYETKEEILKINKRKNTLDNVIKCFDCPELIEIIK